MKVSYHCGREGLARHNDRDFDLSCAPHIDKDRSKQNLYWQMPGYEGMSFTAMEAAYYRDTYGAGQEAINARYRKQGHKERCRSVDDLLHDDKTKPEEVILAIGDRKDDISPEAFKVCFREFCHKLQKWNNDHAQPMQVLNIAVHADEQGAVHAHLRRVWHYRDKDGNLRLGQDKALKAAGVDLPDPDKPSGRYNNRKINFDTICRQWWQEAVRDQGYDIDTEPEQTDRKHLSTADYIRQDNAQAQARLQQTRAEQRTAAARLDNIQGEILDKMTEADKYAADRQQEADTKLQTVAEAIGNSRALKADAVLIDKLDKAANRIIRNHKPGFFGVRLSSSEYKQVRKALATSLSLKLMAEKSAQAVQELQEVGRAYISIPTPIQEHIRGLEAKYEQSEQNNDKLQEELLDTRAALAKKDKQLEAIRHRYPKVWEAIKLTTVDKTRPSGR